MQPLAVHDIVRECWAFFLDRRRALTQACSLWFVLLLLVSVIARGMMGPVEMPDPETASDTIALPSGMGGLVVLKLAEALVLAAASVALHRSILLDEPLPPILPIDARSVRYALRMVGMLLASMLPVMLIVLVALVLGGGGIAAIQLAILPSMIAMLLVICRLHPVLPASALDLKASFSQAWERTRSQGFRLLLGAIILLAPVMIGSTLLLLVLGGGFADVPILRNLPQAVALLTDLLEACLLAIYFSLTWRRLSQPEQPLASTSA
jgi:hypothetical protein